MNAAFIAAREQYHAAQRAELAMLADARGFRAIAADATAQPDVYGDRAITYAEGIAARYLLLAEFAEYEAKRQAQIAQSLRRELMQVAS